ncbi:MAG: T9SS type A sorting domain-containing protein, partial [Bacteroidota bacterium]
VTGTEERMPEKISLYPNPSDGLFTIESAEKSLAFQLVDLHGRTLLSGTAPEGKSVWSMKELPSGIYLLKMAGDQQTVKKIVRR